MTVISDTGPIIAFAKIHQLTLLKSLFDKVYITPVVFKELMAKIGDEAEEIDKALKEFVIVNNVSPTMKEIEHSLNELGTGEKQTIEFAYVTKGNFVLLMDDKAGRQAAKKLNIPTTGTIGVLILAKNKRLIENVTKILEDMRIKGYWLSDEIIKIAKKIADE